MKQGKKQSQEQERWVLGAVRRRGEQEALGTSLLGEHHGQEVSKRISFLLRAKLGVKKVCLSEDRVLPNNH